MPLNANNFLLWYLVGESPSASSLPQPFVHEPDILSPAVWLVPGEQVSFYVNTIDDAALTGALSIIDERNGNHAIDGSLQTFDFPGGQHTYGQCTVPNLEEGFYRLRINNYLSQWLFLTNSIRAKKYTAVVEFRNDRRVMNFRYGYLPEDYYQRFRVRLARKSAEPTTNKKMYREVTTGKTRLSHSEPGKIVTFMTDEYDEGAHFAMAAMLEHDTILINGIPYAFNSGYKANMSEDQMLSRGEFVLSDERESTLHRS